MQTDATHPTLQPHDPPTDAVPAGPPQAPRVAALLQDAALRLREARSALFRPNPDYRATLSSSLQSVRKSFHAFLTWHGLPLPDNARLRALTRRAEALASILRTSANRTHRLETLTDALPSNTALTHAQKEEIQMGYYGARNSYFTVTGELPRSLHPAPPVPRSTALQ